MLLYHYIIAASYCIPTPSSAARIPDKIPPSSPLFQYIPASFCTSPIHFSLCFIQNYDIHHFPDISMGFHFTPLARCRTLSLLFTHFSRFIALVQHSTIQLCPCQNQPLYPYPVLKHVMCFCASSRYYIITSSQHLAVFPLRPLLLISRIKHLLPLHCPNIPISSCTNSLHFGLHFIQNYDIHNFPVFPIALLAFTLHHFSLLPYRLITPQPISLALSL